MRRVALLGAAVAAAALVAAGLTAATPAAAESNGGVRIMPLGDSITDGITVSGAYRTSLWQRFTGAGAKVDFVGSLYGGPSTLGDHDHEGHSGWRIDQLDASIVTWLRNTQPRTVLLHIGTNDISQNYQLSTAPQRLSGLIDKITATVPNVHLFVATIIPLSYSQSQLQAYNAQIPGIVQAKASAGKNVRLVNMNAALTTADLADGVHPNAGGYAKMAATWWSALQQDPSSYSDGTTTTTTSRTTTTSTTSRTTTTTTTTTSRTATTTTTPQGGGGGCTAAYAVQNSWPGGFVANVTVTAGSSLSGWRVTMNLPSGTSIAGLWNGTASGSSGTVTVSNAAYNGSVAAGQSTQFGFQGNGSGSGVAVSCSAA